MQQRNSVIWAMVMAVLLVVLGGWWYMGSRTSEPSVIKIGALLPLSGKLASYGEDIRNALTLAQEDLRESGGVDFDIIYEDSGADPKTALSGARKLIDINAVSLVIGGPGSSANLAVAPVFQEERVLFLPTSNTSKLNSAGDYIFKLNPDVDFEASRMATYVRNAGIEKIAVLYDSANDTTTAGATVFRDSFAKVGGHVVFFEGIDSKTTNDFRTQLTSFKTTKPDALYIIMAGKLTGIAVRQMRELGLQTRVFAWSALNEPEFFSSAADYSDGVTITDQPFSCERDARMRQFCTAYSTHFSGRKPTTYGAIAYDVLRIISDTLKKHRAKAINDVSSAIIQAAFTSKEHTGVSGTLQFDKDGNIRDTDFVFRVAKGGKFVEVK